MSSVKLTEVVKSYGTVKVLHGINLDIRKGEFVVFVGPSGCGKSTLLRMIAGLEEISGGTLEIGGQVVNELPPAKRGIAMVFQSYALYPHMTVYDNMAFSLKLANASKEELDKRVREAADMLQITQYLARLPKQLSGGQRQRVAIGRAIVRNPKVFLFDEPLSNLDAALRVATRIEIAKLHERMHETTMIYVTHDQVEAMTLADRIVVLNGGRIEQVGTPMELYHAPDNLFVARFIGSPAMNILPATIAGAGSPAEVTLKGGSTVKVPATVPASAIGSAASFGVRPEDLTLTDGPGLFAGSVTIVERLGENTLLYVEAGGAEPVIAKVAGTAPVKRGDTVRLTAGADRLHLFDANGKAFARTASALAA